MNYRANKGKKAEKMVAEYLRKNGFSIYKMNYHCRFGEIDIVAENDEYLLFVEVKMRGENSLTTPAEAVDNLKQHRIIMTAKDFIYKSSLYELQPRFDVAEVYEISRGSEKAYRLNYIKNAFGE